MSTKPPYRTVSMKTEFIDYLEEFIKTNTQYGYRSLAQFLEDASRRRLEELKAAEKELPRMEQINCDENGCKILDRKLHRVADIALKPSGIDCSIDRTDSCDHVKFALAQRDIRGIIAKKRKEGWKLPDV